MKQLIYKMSQIRPRDFCVMLKLGVTFLPARIYKIFHKDVWVVTELSENARDNGCLNILEKKNLIRKFIIRSGANHLIISR